MTLQLKAGHYYKDRNGTMIGPMTKFPEFPDQPWTDGNCTWDDGGRFYSDPIACAWDLVKDLGTTDPRKKPKREKKAGRSYTVWAFESRMDGKIDLERFSCRGLARIARRINRSERIQCGPIFRVTITAPAWEPKGKK